jgi:hypothetical protein
MILAPAGLAGEGDVIASVLRRLMEAMPSRSSKGPVSWTLNGVSDSVWPTLNRRRLVSRGVERQLRPVEGVV